MRPNIVVGVEDGESMYKKWYFEVIIDHIEQVTHVQPHIRIGWATTHFQPSPGHGDGFSSNGIGDNTYSYGFDGQNIWFAGRAYNVSNNDIKQNGLKKNDVIGCLLDLDIPEMWFSLNGLPVKGLIREFNLNGMFYPVISLSSRVSCRFIFGGEHGRFTHRPPEGVAPIYEAMLIKQRLCIEPCFSFGNIERNCLNGPLHIRHNIAFTPQPVRTKHINLPTYLEDVCDRLAANTHELWCMSKIANGWRFGEHRDDTQKINPCLTSFDNLPSEEKQHNITTTIENLKSLFAFGYHIGIEIKTDERRLKYIKLPNSYVQSNGYKPQPLDLSNINLSTKMDELIELLAENTHNVWAAARIKDGFTYGVSDNAHHKRSPYLLPYSIIDDSIKKINRDTASEIVKTLLAYGYTIDTPTGDIDDHNRRNKDIKNNEPMSSYRTYRVEKTFAVTRGKWYYEVELLTSGRMLIGWGHPSKLSAFDPLGTDLYGYAFDGLNARRLHHNTYDRFGKQWTKNDVVGCMIDLHDKTISFSLNGELMLDNYGNETAFDGLNIDNIGFVPALTSFSGQKARLNFGQDVHSLKYFTSCGLQEGYEPFCVNMSKNATFWYSNFVPRFIPIKQDSPSFEVIRIGASRDNPPIIKLQSRLFGTLEKVEFEFLRLSLPISCHDKFVPRHITLEQRYAILNEYLESPAEKHNFIFLSRPKMSSSNEQIETSITNQSLLDQTDSFVKFLDQSTSKTNSSPIINENKSNIKTPTNKINSFFHCFLKEQQQQQHQQHQQEQPTKRIVKLNTDTNRIQNQLQATLRHSIRRMTHTARKSTIENENEFNDQQTNDYANDDIRVINEYVHEYYYAIRILPGQNPRSVFIGWVTSRFKPIDRQYDTTTNKLTKFTRYCTITQTSDKGSIVESIRRQDAYMFCASDLLDNMIDKGNVARRVANGLVIGCLCDVSTGQLTFYVNGKESTQKFQVYYYFELIVKDIITIV
ncbi:unnamed protein product [Rotaria sordida]|nr:unnamed protein product [Rotaria sordida]